MNVIKSEIISSTYAPELLVAVPHEVIFKINPTFDPSDVPPVFILVYRFESRLSENEYVYKFVGGRVK